MSVLVTGGSGFLGSRLRLHRPDWIYVSSSDYNLLDRHECTQMFEDIGPTAVIHLAAIVGGIKANAENQAKFFTENCLINLNVISAAHKFGVERLLAALSTCAFPDQVKRYPFTELDIFDGPPAQTNFSYGYSKRMLHVLVNSYREQYGVNYSTFSPSNLYGIGDNFDPHTSHFVPALIRKIYQAKDVDTVEFWGTGRPMRQQLFVDDLVNIIPELLGKHCTNLPLIVAATENLSIRSMAETCCKIARKNINIVFNGNLDGQYRKDGDNFELIKLLGEISFTPFETGIDKTYKWYGDLNE